MRVLFVCLGNICRSPMAEAIFKDILIKKGRNDIRVSSSGTSNYHIGENADPRTLKCLAENGIQFTHTASQITINDIEEHDIILAMDRRNYQDILAMIPGRKEYLKEKVMLMRDFDESVEDDVPDPYFGGSGGFQEVFDILENACTNFYNQQVA